ncbi:MAG: DUF6492 family protein [Alphaproteobacteria bacterium]|nr:DUF6492 family protein [Alphaproteobacteria bacterium]
MKNFVMFCKTYSGDLHRFKLMLESFNKYNIDKLLMVVSAPEAELDIFNKFASGTVQIISDESYAGRYFTDKKLHNLPVGYINQEICKLAFWESKIAKHYLCVDSDLLFIRNFQESDFMADKDTPYTILVMDKDLAIEKHYHAFWLWRQEFIKKIYDTVGLKDCRYRTCHGMQVFSAKVLKSLKDDFMKSHKYSYADLIAIAPYEFTFYNAWFQKCGLVREVAVEPFFKTFHMRIEYTLSRLRGLNLDDYAYSYVGIVLNGNWRKPSDHYEKQTWWMKRLYKILKRV